MMTTADLKNRNLKTGIGYEKRDVDVFLEEIIASYEELYRSNVELTDRVTSLNEGLQHYKTIEASLQKTLILAERTAEETVNEAKEKAKQIEDEARGNTGKIALEAKKELDAILEKTSELVQKYNDLKSKMKTDLSAQIAALDNSQVSFDATKYHVDFSFSTKEEVKSSVSAQPEVKAETATSYKVQPEIKTEPQPTIRPEVKVEPQSFVQQETKVEPQPFVQPEVKVEPQPFVQPEVKVNSQPEAQATVKVDPQPAIRPEVKVEPQPTTQPEVKATEDSTIPQPAAAKFLRSQTPESFSDTKVEPKAEETSSAFNLNLGGGSTSSSSTEETGTPAENENKLGINLNTTSTATEDTSYDDPDEDSYEFEVEDSAFRSKRNANGQMLIGNDDEESGFEFLSEL